jgi:hypothetical protein
MSHHMPHVTPLTMPDISCLLSAVLFVTANVLNVVHLVKERNRGDFDWEKSGGLGQPKSLMQL